jgi:hypothetical protein
MDLGKEQCEGTTYLGAVHNRHFYALLSTSTFGEGFDPRGRLFCCRPEDWLEDGLECLEFASIVYVPCTKAECCSRQELRHRRESSDSHRLRLAFCPTPRVECGQDGHSRVSKVLNQNQKRNWRGYEIEKRLANEYRCGYEDADGDYHCDVLNLAEICLSSRKWSRT